MRAFLADVRGTSMDMGNGQSDCDGMFRFQIQNY